MCGRDSNVERDRYRQREIEKKDRDRDIHISLQPIYIYARELGRCPPLPLIPS